jgi:hypothetical protein
MNIVMSETKDAIDYTSHNLHQKIVDVMGMVKYLEYDGKVQFSGTNYRYLSETKITTMVRDAMKKVGLTLVPVRSESAQFSIDGRAITGVTMTYRLTNSDNPEEYIDVQMSGFGRDNMDKGILKAQTAAFKYAQRQAFMIPTGDDPDDISSDELEHKAKVADDKKTTEPEPKKEAPKPSPKPTENKTYTSEIRQWDRNSYRSENIGPLEQHASVAIPDAVVDAIHGMKDVQLADLMIADYKGEAVLAFTKFPNNAWKVLNEKMIAINLHWCRADKSSHWFSTEGGIDKANFPSGDGLPPGAIAIASKSGETIAHLIYDKATDKTKSAELIPLRVFNRKQKPWEGFLVASLDRRIIEDLDHIKSGSYNYEPFEYETFYTDDGVLLKLRLVNLGPLHKRRSIESNIRWTLERMLSAQES